LSISGASSIVGNPWSAWYNFIVVAISVSEIQRDFPAYLRRVQAGESLLITDHNRAVAEIKPIGPVFDGPRPAGLCAGEYTVLADFDAPLPGDLLRDFGSL
jgi:prevent-host-death family protein